MGHGLPAEPIQPIARARPANTGRRAQTTVASNHGTRKGGAGANRIYRPCRGRVEAERAVA
jgi:hypothetical protein